MEWTLSLDDPHSNCPAGSGRRRRAFSPSPRRACPHHVAAAARAARDSGHSMIEADRQELEANLKLLTLQIREKEVGRVAPVLRGRARAR